MQFLEATVCGSRYVAPLLFDLCRKDIKVTLKKQYNQENRVLKNLLSGDEWYCQQTFRALNQAVGEWVIFAFCCWFKDTTGSTVI